MLTLHICGNLVVSSHLKNEGQLLVESSKRHGPIVILHISYKDIRSMWFLTLFLQKNTKRNRKKKDMQEVIYF